MNMDVIERLLKLAFGFMTAIASVTLACIALLALYEAQRQWMILPAPENFIGDLDDKKKDDKRVYLRWEPPASDADMVSRYVVLRWSNQGNQKWEVMETVEELPRNKQFYNSKLCEKFLKDKKLRCLYRVQAIALNNRKGELSRWVVCTTKKCGYMPDGETKIVWPTAAYEEREATQ